MASENIDKKTLANRFVQLIWKITNMVESPYWAGYLAGVKAAIEILRESDPEFAREYEKAIKG